MATTFVIVAVYSLWTIRGVIFRISARSSSGRSTRKEAFLAENESELTLLQMSIPLIRETEPEPEPEHIISIGKGKEGQRVAEKKGQNDDQV
jgi:hypothetical protein